MGTENKTKINRLINHREAVFALKGGTAINFFARDLPRVSVDIDLVYLPAGERDLSLREISDALVRICRNQERQFIVSVKEGMPQWDLIGLEGVQNLPAVQWKLLNIGRMAPAKHSKALRKLRDYLNI